MTGESSRVATTVAIEFAASCNPFRKSNSNARMISAISSGSASSCTAARSGVIDDDAVDLVGDIFEGVDDALEVLVDLALDEKPQRVAAAVVGDRLPEPGPMDLVGVALDPDQPLGQLVQPR